MKNLLQNKKIGIWGFGTVGKSVLSFLSQFECTLSILDNNKLDAFQQSLAEGHNATVISKDFLPQFLEMNDFIIPSPGVDISKYMKSESLDNQNNISHKFITELDLFYAFNTTPTIAITGSVGKTTTVHLLTHILDKLGKKALSCGNIGFPLLDTIAEQKKYDYLVLELSSFQLEYIKSFRPDHAGLINIYPNHLDRHCSMPDYVAAKGALFTHQTENDWAYLPLEYTDIFWDKINKQHVSWIGPSLHENITKVLSDITCPQNLQIILTILENLDLPTDSLKELCSDYTLPADRVEFLGIHKGISFYNDSKATIPEATYTAISQFKSPLLFLGGLSKGVDRTPLLESIQNKTKEIICFGAEADELYKKCALLGIKASSHKTLEAAFAHGVKIAESGDTVLFSPAGSSFDLFKNYHERGNAFKKLVKEYCNK